MYEIIHRLCMQKGVTVTKMCKDLNISPSTLSELKRGRTVRLSGQTLAKVSDYLGVSADVLLGAETKAEIKIQPISVGDELIEILDACKERSDLRGLFCVAKDLPPDDIRKAMAIFEAFKNG